MGPYATEQYRHGLETIANYLECSPPEWFSMDCIETCVFGVAIHLEIDLLSTMRKEYNPYWSISHYNWIYDAEWKRVDNTALGAAKRIRYYLEHGIPSDYHEQLLGINYMFA